MIFNKNNRLRTPKTELSEVDGKKSAQETIDIGYVMLFFD